MTLHVILEGGRSDNERLELDIEHPAPYLERAGETYNRVLDYYNQPMRDITGRWRYRVHVEKSQTLRPGHSAIDVKP